jgi:hypothetical protein
MEERFGGFQAPPARKAGETPGDPLRRVVSPGLAKL